MKQNLWGHAVFLPSEMDLKTNASIITCIANGSMKTNDLLQILYQHMSGHQAAAITVSNNNVDHMNMNLVGIAHIGQRLLRD